MRSCIHDLHMNLKLIALLIICIAAMSVAGCTTHSAEPVGTTTVPTTPFLPPPATTASPVQAAECTREADCVPAECCHPSRCTAVAAKHVCNLMCTASCEGPLDCGAGSCGCVKGKCSVIPGSSASPATLKTTSITIKASPLHYSPMMSSTPGIGLEPVASGFSAENASFEWKATYGWFLSWNAPDFRVNQVGDSATNHGEKLYWSFIDRPTSTETPVTITVTAKDTGSGRVLGTSAVHLIWADNLSVTVKEGE
jgi:hypothetical protein